MVLRVPTGWVFLLLVNGKSTCRPSKYDKLFGDENEPPFQTDITNCLTKMFQVFPHFSSFGLIYARSCQNISLEYDWNYKNRSLGSYLGCCQDIFKIRNIPNPDQARKSDLFIFKNYYLQCIKIRECQATSVIGSKLTICNFIDLINWIVSS